MPSSPSSSFSDPRLALLKDWLAPALAQVFAQAGWGRVSAGNLAPASSDASFRRYFRWQDANGQRSLIVMDAPPPQEDCRPFVRIAALLAEAGLHVPRIFAADIERGFLLLEDLGTQTYLDALNAALRSPQTTPKQTTPKKASSFCAYNAGSFIPQDLALPLFDEALDALVVMQSRCCAAAPPAALPVYDRALLERELNLFADWYLARYMGMPLLAAQLARWRHGCRLLVDGALAQTRVLVHRDFMVRNLMCSTPNPGILDFQDAVIGPVSYDPVCLFADALHSWERSQVDDWLHRYWHKARAVCIGVPDDFEVFLCDCDLMSVQRHLKVIGIAARLACRDGKPKLLADVPRFFHYLDDVLARRPQLAVLGELLASTTGVARDTSRFEDGTLFDESRFARCWQQNAPLYGWPPLEQQRAEHLATPFEHVWLLK